MHAIRIHVVMCRDQQISYYFLRSNSARNPNTVGTYKLQTYIQMTVDGSSVLGAYQNVVIAEDPELVGTDYQRSSLCAQE